MKNDIGRMKELVQNS